jgi:Restriction endonuclease
MNRDQVLKKYNEIVQSRRISKFEELVNFLNSGLGDVIYEDIKKTDHEFLNILNALGVGSPRETFYVWQQFYNYLTEKEYANSERIELNVLYFWMGSTLHRQAKKGYGKYYLKAYVEDIGFHTNYLNGGAIQVLMVHCYLGQKGIDLLDSMLKQATETTSIDELKNYIKKSTRGEFERLIVEIENKFSLEGNEYFFLPLTALKEILLQIDPLVKKRGNKARYKLLEQLCQLLFGSINGFRYKMDERSTLFQLDGLIENTSDHPFLKELGNTITVEAKQYYYKSRIERKFIDVLAMNMTRVGATSAFLVTTANLSKPAEKEIYHNYLRRGAFIIPLFYNEIKELFENKLSFPVLISSKVSNIKSNRRL